MTSHSRQAPRALVCVLAATWSMLALPGLHVAEHAAGQAHTHGPGHKDPGRVLSLTESAGERARRVLEHARAHAQALHHLHDGEQPAEHAHPSPASEVPGAPAPDPAHGQDSVEHLGAALVLAPGVLIPSWMASALSLACAGAPRPVCVASRRSSSSPRGPPVTRAALV